MKTQILSYTLLFGLISGVFAEEVKPQVSLSVKRQVLSTDRNGGGRSESSEKEITLRVEVKNVTYDTLEGAELTGNVLLNRSVNEKERIVLEALKSLKLPPMKPNEKITVDLGTVVLNKVRWGNRIFEESLEEWKVVCKKGETNIGENVSDRKYDALIAEMKKEKEEDKREAEERVIRGRDNDDPRNIRRNLRK
jgi:hypothetical protein